MNIKKYKKEAWAHFNKAKVVPDEEDILNYVLDCISDETGVNVEDLDINKIKKQLKEETMFKKFIENNERFLNESETSQQKPSGNYRKHLTENKHAELFGLLWNTCYKFIRKKDISEQDIIDTLDSIIQRIKEKYLFKRWE
jgi:hypothetical protein